MNNLQLIDHLGYEEWPKYRTGAFVGHKLESRFQEECLISVSNLYCHDLPENSLYMNFRNIFLLSRKYPGRYIPNIAKSQQLFCSSETLEVLGYKHPYIDQSNVKEMKKK